MNVGTTAMPDGTGSAVERFPRDVPADMAQRLIVALDVEHVDEAKALVDRLDGVVSFFKIGFRLQITEGFDSLVKAILASRKKIFLDAKMFDIPETVETAVRAAAKRGVSFITVHGDENILKAAVKGRGQSGMKVFAVTVLTSLDNEALKSMGYAVTAKELVQLRANKAVTCGCDGIIASADDNPDGIRALAHSDRLLIATPGIRDKGSEPDDQKRTATPREAIQNGADYLVVGRPITGDPDPSAAAKRFISEMEHGQKIRAANRA